MPDYTPRQLDKSSGSFQSVDPVLRSNRKAEKQSAFLELASRFAGGAARGYAKKQGREVAGVGTTAVDQQENIDLFQDELKVQTNAARREKGDDLSRAEMEDLRQNALAEFGDSTQQLKRMVQQNKISSVEAEARMDQLLSAKLANPFTVMFEQEFRQQAAHYTGDFGLSPDEAEAKRQQAAFEKKRAATLEISAHYMQGGMGAEQANANAESQMSFEADTDYRAQKLANQEIANKDEIVYTLSDNQTVFNDKMARAVNGMLDKDGRLTVEGQLAAKQMISSWRIQQEELIDKSGLSVADKQYHRKSMADYVANLSNIATSASSGEFFKLQRELGINYVTSEFLKNHPLATMFMKNNMPDLAKIAIYSEGEKRQALLDSLGIDSERYDRMKEGTFFRGGIDGVLVPLPTEEEVFDPNNMKQDEVLAAQAVEEGFFTKLYNNFFNGDEKRKKKLEDIAIKGSIVGNGALIASDANVELMRDGDENIQSLYSRSLEAKLNQLKGDTLFEPIGTIKPKKIPASTLERRPDLANRLEFYELEDAHPAIKGQMKSLRQFLDPVMKLGLWKDNFDTPEEALNAIINEEWLPYSQGTGEDEGTVDEYKEDRVRAPDPSTAEGEAFQKDMMQTDWKAMSDGEFDELLKFYRKQSTPENTYAQRTLQWIEEAAKERKK